MSQFNRLAVVIYLSLLSQNICTSAEQADLRSVVCPGDTVNYVCANTGITVIRSYIWCLSSTSETYCSSSYTELGEQISAIENTTYTANLCGCDDSSMYFNFNATFLNQLEVSITVPQQTTTKLRIVCEGMNLDCQYLQVAGVPSPPQNFTHVPDYRAANDTHVVVNLMWAAAPEVDRDGVSVEYTIIITDLSRSVTTNTSTTNTTFTTSLQFYVPHLITLYTSTCGHTLISDNFTTNITMSYCLPPPVVSGVEVITIGEGVIAYQCEEGLVPEGRVEAMCGADGKWSPDPTQHMCIAMTTTTSTDSTSATSTDITGQETITEASTNIKVIIGSSVSSAVVLIVVLLLIVLLIWKISKCSPKKTCPQRETIIPATSSSHIENTSTDNGYSVFHHEGNNWKPTRDEEYSNLECVTNHSSKGPSLDYSILNLPQHVRVSRGVRVQEADYSHVNLPMSAQVESYSTITITQSEEITRVSTSLEAIKYSELDKNDNIPGLDKLVSIVRKRSDLWQSLGKALKVPEEKLELIGNHCQTDFDSMVELCDTWINQLRDEDVVPSWLTIHAALEEIGDHQLAAEVKDIEINGYKLNEEDFDTVINEGAELKKDQDVSESGQLTVATYQIPKNDKTEAEDACGPPMPPQLF